VTHNHKNIQDACHGGALATLIDVTTTVSILRVSPFRTLSISLSTEFLSMVKLGEKIGVETEVTKIGKNVVYTDCRIYNDIVHEGKNKLVCRGSHIKSLLTEKWDFLM
jgi:acyl-coenzyme A thioesterase 13